MRRPPVNGKNLQSNSGPRQKAGVRNNARNEMRCRAAGSGAGVLRTGGIGKSVPQRLHNHSFLSSLMNGAYHKVFSFAIGKFIILQNTYKRTYFRRAAPAPLVHNGEKISVIPTAKKYRKTQPADAEKCRLRPKMKKRKKSIDKCTGAGYYSTVLARLAQLVEHMLDVHGVTGSSPVPRTMNSPGITTVSPLRYTMCHGGTVGTGKSKTQTQMHEFASCFFT